MKKVTITRLRVLEIVNNADKLKSLQGVKLTYAISKNLKALKAEVEAMQESNKPSEEMQKYNDACNELVIAEAKRDDKGEFIPAGPNQIVLKDASAYKAKRSELDEKYKDEIEKAKVKNAEFDILLKEPFEFEFYQVQSEFISEEITCEQMDLILEMVKE